MDWGLEIIGQKNMLNKYLQDNIQTRGNMRFIHCPEVVALYSGTEIETKIANRQYEYIKSKRATLFAAGDYEGFVCMTERPYRLDALVQIITTGKCNAEKLAHLLINVWIGSENPSNNEFIWRGLFAEFRNTRTFQKSKQDLPPQITIWRGGNKDGLSWTTDKEKANWFANRFNQSAPVHKRIILRDEAVCFIPDRNESEIILL